MNGRIIVFGDIHGNATAFSSLLEMLRPDPRDTFLFLGDLLDHGPNTSAVIDKIIELKKASKVIAIKGNHEELCLAALDDPDSFMGEWMRQGGEQTLASYPGGQVTREHVEFMRGMRDAYFLGRYVFSHAGYDPLKNIKSQSPEILRWKHDQIYSDYRGGTTLICGHTPQASGVPFVSGNRINLDTGIGNGLWLTAFDIGSNRFYQSDRKGKIRLLQNSEVAA